MKDLSRFFSLLLGGRLRSPPDFFEALRLQRAEDEQLPSDDRFFSLPMEGESMPVLLKRLSVSETFFLSSRYLALHDRADWSFVDPALSFFAASFIERLRSRGIPMYVHSAFRSKREQDALLEAKTSKLEYPLSAHNQGMAVDIVHARFHWDMTRQEWSVLGKIGKEVATSLGFDVVWGGDWSFYDPAHWQVAGYRDRGLRRLVRSLDQDGKEVFVRRTPRSFLRRS